MKRILIAAVFAACAATAWALPSVDAVRTEVAQGHDARAEEMIREVLAARPDSARARYVHAEILAHLGRFAQAAEEATQARRLDPALSFTQPDTFKAFEAMLAREQAPAAGLRAAATALQMAPAGSSGGVPGWVWGGGLALLAVLALSRLTSARQPAPTSGPMGAPAGWAAAPAAPGIGGMAAPYGMAPTAPAAGAGSGLLGAGLAAAGGVAAGMLAERLMKGHREPANGGWWGAAPSPAALEPFDDSAAAAARELEQRPIDWGSGDGWGGSDDDKASSAGSDGW